MTRAPPNRARPEAERRQARGHQAARARRGPHRRARGHAFLADGIEADSANVLTEETVEVSKR